MGYPKMFSLLQYMPKMRNKAREIVFLLGSLNIVNIYNAIYLLCYFSRRLLSLFLMVFCEIERDSN